MRENYVTPQIEVIEIEIEDAVLGASTSSVSSVSVSSVSNGGSAW